LIATWPGAIVSCSAVSAARRPGIADAVDQLLRNRIVGGAGLIVFHSLLVIDQSGGQHIGLTVVEVVKQLADILATVILSVTPR
jgi:hypothetical protein